MKNLCTADTCTTPIAEGLLMCAHHWGKVTHKTQTLVYRTLRAWRAGDSAGPYLKAREQAIAEASGRKTEVVN